MSAIRKTALYFSDDEIRCHGVGCGCGNGFKLDEVFDGKLFNLRRVFGLPIRATNVCRCRAHNTSVGGVAHSFHIYDKPQWPKVTGCAAIDAAYNDMGYRTKLAECAWNMGFRIGFNRHFLHLDSGAHIGLLHQTIFKYDNVTDEELAAFKRSIGVTWL